MKVRNIARSAVLALAPLRPSRRQRHRRRQGRLGTAEELHRPLPREGPAGRQGGRPRRSAQPLHAGRIPRLAAAGGHPQADHQGRQQRPRLPDRTSQHRAPAAAPRSTAAPSSARRSAASPARQRSRAGSAPRSTPAASARSRPSSSASRPSPPRRDSMNASLRSRLPLPRRRWSSPRRSSSPPAAAARQLLRRLLVLGRLDATPRPRPKAPTKFPQIEDWPYFGRDRDNTRFATQDEVDTDNVDELGEAWRTGARPRPVPDGGLPDR